MKEFLSGNEAIARGAFEGNAWVATGYLDTPSSEVIYEISNKYKEINSEWSVNEKVALEIAIGSSLAWARTIVTMKHVGLNVAADPLMTLTYTITAMTGHQPNANTGLNNKYEKTDNINLIELVKGLGVKRVIKANAYKKDELKKIIIEENK